jgi:hypothetical protein
MICYAVLIGFVILVIWVIIQEEPRQKKVREAQQEWQGACKSVEVAIVDRFYYPGGSWEDEYGIPHSSHASYTLYIELPAEQKVDFPNLQSVSVDVSGEIYSKLLDRNVVRVYYKPDSPMTFLLEDEIAGVSQLG